MGRIKREIEYERLNLEVHPKILGRIDAIRDQTLADSRSQVIRRALAVYDLLITQQNDGNSVIVRQKNGQEREVLLVE